MKRKEAIVFTILLLFSLLPNIVVMCLAEDVALWTQRIWYAATTMALYGVGMALLHRRAFLYMVSIGFILSAFEVCHVWFRHTTTTMMGLYLWIKTSPEELKTMFQPYIGWVVAGVVVWILFYVAAHRWVAREWTGRWRVRIPIAIACAAFFMLSPAHVCPTNVLYRLSRVAAMAAHIEKTQPEQRTFEYGVTPSNSKAEETLIVVLSETSYDQWKAIGYRDSLAICFDSVYTSSPVSGAAIPMVLSRATADNMAPFFVERSVIRAFGEADFYTAWLSNYGYHDHLLMRIADDCRYLSYLPGEPDTALLVPFREAMAQPSQRHMMVLATQGGRAAGYDSITPVLLRQLTDSLRTTHQPAMLVYVGCPNISLKDDRSELHAPLVVWTNPNYRYRHRPLIRALTALRGARISTDDIFHSLLYWHGIECPQRDDRDCIGHIQFEAADTIRYLDEDLQAQSLIFEP